MGSREYWNSTTKTEYHEGTTRPRKIPNRVSWRTQAITSHSFPYQNYNMPMQKLVHATIDIIENYLRQHGLWVGERSGGVPGTWWTHVYPEKIKGELLDYMVIVSNTERWPVVELDFYRMGVAVPIHHEVDVSSEGAMAEILEFWNEERRESEA